jgi:hypothetical protein
MGKPHDPEGKPTPASAFRLQSTCTRRYGRATLTIRRWGGLNELLGDSALAKKVNAFRKGETATEDVAWAFVRARVKSHSPSFDWKTADLRRLIPLIAGCSEEPKLAVVEADELAHALVRAQDEQRLQMREIGQHMSTAVTRTSEIARRTSLPLTAELFRQQQLSLKGTFPPFAAVQAAQLAHFRGAQRITLPQRAHAELAQSLRRAIAASAMSTSLPAIADLTARRSFGWTEFARAVSAASQVSARQGGLNDARHLKQVASEITRVSETPSRENIEALLEDVVDTLGEIEQEIKAGRREQGQREADRERREHSRFVITIYVMIALFLLQWLIQTSPPPQ